MAYAGQTISNPVSGERITFMQTARDTDGELLEFELELTPDGSVPGAHVHPEQEERFHVLSGRMKFRRGFRRIVAEAGETVVVPAGTVHKFENAGDDVARCRVEVVPALDMEHLLETTVELALEGNVMRSGRCSISSAGTTSTRQRATSSPAFSNLWTVPAGTTTVSPASATMRRRPRRDSIRPESTWKRSSCSGCTCAPGTLPSGASSSSNSSSSPRCRRRSA